MEGPTKKITHERSHDFYFNSIDIFSCSKKKSIDIFDLLVNVVNRLFGNLFWSNIISFHYIC